MIFSFWNNLNVLLIPPPSQDDSDTEVSVLCQVPHVHLQLDLLGQSHLSLYFRICPLCLLWLFCAQF